ncbi:MAG: hypothetical protein H5U40_08850, partial [Polyangiaceae bacterium]|nr:hypothetical protein [Polyangiaceae bacterium]
MLMSSPSERRAFALFALVIACIAIAPIWSTRFLPVLDEPNHLSAIAIWHGLWIRDPWIESFYSLRVAPGSYFAHYGLAVALAKVVGVEAAHKVALSLYVLAIPGAAILWCDRTQRSRWLAVLTVPLAFSTNWAHGYHPFNAGMAALFLGVVAFDRLLTTPSPAAFVWAAAAGVACYFGHPLLLVLLYVAASILVVIHRARPGVVLSAFAALLPSLSLLVWQSRATRVTAGATDSVLGSEFPVVDAAVWWARIRDFADHAVNPLAGEWDSLLLVALVALSGALYAAGIVGGTSGGGLKKALVAHRSLVLALAFTALYLVLPEHFNQPVYMWIARGRLAPAIAFFVLLAPPVGAASGLRFAAAAAALLVVALPIELS